ncbi:MAG: PRC-barrel domain-containing protein [Candidatus Micrarchaeota archaeon]
MAKPVLGSSLKGKKVVSKSGTDIGFIEDIHFEIGGKLVSIAVRPETNASEITEFVGKSGLLDVPFAEVEAVGSYVVINFPFSSK